VNQSAVLIKMEIEVIQSQPNYLVTKKTSLKILRKNFYKFSFISVNPVAI